MREEVAFYGYSQASYPHFEPCAITFIGNRVCTRLLFKMLNRKRIETKQQLSSYRSRRQLSCFQVSLQLECDILAL